jgi:hypothetical protein
MDTGGANWTCLYSRLDLARLRKIERKLIPLEGFPPEHGHIECIGDWLHMTNFATSVDLPPEYRNRLNRLKRQEVRRRLSGLGPLPEI